MKPAIRRDYQRARVYAWEDRVIAPRDPSRIAFAVAGAMVTGIWADLGLRFPPAVEPLPARFTRVMAQGSRLLLRLPDPVPSWCLLHELAHALGSTHEGASDLHGPVFVGLYVHLLERYLRLDRSMLLTTLTADGIDLDPAARPLFVDASAMPLRQL